MPGQTQPDGNPWDKDDFPIPADVVRTYPDYVTGQCAGRPKCNTESPAAVAIKLAATTEAFAYIDAVTRESSKVTRTFV